MPLTLALNATPRQRRRRQPWATPDPKSRRLKRIALGLVPPLTTLWSTLLRDLRDEVAGEDLRAAFAPGHNLDAEQVLTDAWQMTVEEPARRLLPVLLTELWDDVGETLTPERKKVSGGVLFPLLTDLPGQHHERDTYVGQQLLSLWMTTLLSFRQAARRSRQTNETATAHADAVAQTIGLTPRQASQIDTATAQWQEEGVSDATIQQRQDEATARALALRVQGIAETEAFGIVNLAQRQVMQQTADAAGVTLTRYWEVQDDERLCDRCAAVPDLNPEGVGMHQPFQTTEEPVMDPPLHAMCRCGVDFQ